MSHIGSFYEFFAGGGMARGGLGARWRCLFANDFDYKKSRMYHKNWGIDVLKTEDVRRLAVRDLPGHSDLAWASFPCQDLSLAGGGAGLKGDRSGTFWPFWKLVKGLVAERREPGMIVLENRYAYLAWRKGLRRDSRLSARAATGGALVVDAALFVPQSRPRLFIVAARKNIEIPSELSCDGPSGPWRERCGPLTASWLLRIRPTGSGGVFPSRRYSSGRGRPG